ncbi:Putative SigmaB asociated two-component system sensor protein [Amycolatopsis camponoti]|uniref:histidine kinase n=1 Tax=Amycolatopsis camponoti TaxID=2606593 RepID=A0A6I8LK14_9PSEU|nr:ATP-binding protein [Amycolatopsis camponoti]VVJ16307.1 Putative SigmaB asociated two-component system sensor protein [Amycolatopsis camponoti]
MTSPRRANELLRMTLSAESGVFAMRQYGREAAQAIGLEPQDQIRVATALSDVGRDLVRSGTEASVAFLLIPAPLPGLAIEITWQGPPAVDVLDVSRATTARLMDEVTTTHEAARGTMTMTKGTTAGSAPMDFSLDALRERLAAGRAAGPLDELRAQNQELLTALDDLESKRRELLRLNEELEETNQGVVALYKELSEELEETNRGVVALYAEINEKTTQLAAVNEAKTRFWSNISHELRSPVNSIVGLARMLGAAGSEPLTGDQQRQVRLINDSGETLLALVNELLDTAKAESGRLVPHPTPIDVRAVLLHLQGVLRSTVPDGVELRIGDTEAGTLVTDETMLVRILRNLLSNAIKFTERGSVGVAATADGEHVRFTVTDTGIGIPAEQLERVFEEFHQVRNKLQAKTSGTGLGLSYARKLAEILGGELTLASEAGQGTTAELRLPARPPGGDITALGSVLVVDDDPVFRDEFTRRIADLSPEVRVAGDGREALETLGGFRPDVVFLDLAMAGMNGREVLAVLRAKDELCDLPVVVTTSAVPDGLDLTAAGLRAALLLKSQISAETVRLAVGEAFAVVRRT